MAKREHNYQKEVERIGREIASKGLTGLYHVMVSHDDWCSIYDGGTCDCNPEVKMGKVK